MTDANDRSKEMNAGVALLLERMKTHPEEFTPPIQHGTSKWADLINAYKDSIDAEDYEALKLGMKKILQDKFTERVLEELVDPKSVMNPYLASPTAMPLGGQTQGLTLASSGTTSAWATTTTTGQVTLPSGSITLGGTTLSEAGLKQMLATHKAMREQTKPKRWWNKSMPELFGKR